MNKRISKENIWEKRGTKLKDIDFYKKLSSKNHTEEEWHNYLYKNFDEIDYNKKIISHIVRDLLYVDFIDILMNK